MLFSTVNSHNLSYSFVRIQHVVSSSLQSSQSLLDLVAAQYSVVCISRYRYGTECDIWYALHTYVVSNLSLQSVAVLTHILSLSSHLLKPNRACPPLRHIDHLFLSSYPIPYVPRDHIILISVSLSLVKWLHLPH